MVCNSTDARYFLTLLNVLKYFLLPWVEAAFATLSQRNTQVGSVLKVLLDVQTKFVMADEEFNN